VGVLTGYPAQVSLSSEAFEAELQAPSEVQAKELRQEPRESQEQRLRQELRGLWVLLPGGAL
jgi:hypothetical protein